MPVKVILDNPYAVYTNLDFITGKAVLSLATDTPITSIVVKLEGESHTRIVGPKYPHSERSEKTVTEIEVHKLLYKVATVFPSQEMLEQALPTSYYTLPAGLYEYPFRFKIPFNNDCINNNLATNLNVGGIGGIRLEVGRPSKEHVKKTLPPSIHCCQGKAEIKYYVKATVARPQFYKENFRGFADFKFLPIEPPRKSDLSRETYARRQHQFAKTTAVPEKKGLFQKKAPPIDINAEPPRYCVDVRLPTPPILTCNEPLPVRILVRKLNESSDLVSLQLLQIELIGYTRIRAHDLHEVEGESLVILSRSNMKFPLGNGSEPVGYEWTLDSSMWNTLPLPASVAPSFDACNISRSYKLEVRAGLSHATGGSSKSELIVIPLQLGVQVYSGIAPPQALLDAMGAKSDKISAAEAAPPPPPRPQQAGHPSQAPLQDEYEDAPPSYEDAMAESLGPVDGPRREYNPPDTSANWTGTDGSGPVDTHKDDDERLFPDSEPLRISTDSTSYSDSIMFVDGPVTPPSQDSPKSPVGHSSAAQNPAMLEPPSVRPETRRVSPSTGVPNRKPVPNSSRPDPAAP